LNVPDGSSGASEPQQQQLGLSTEQAADALRKIREEAASFAPVVELEPEGGEPAPEPEPETPEVEPAPEAPADEPAPEAAAAPAEEPTIETLDDLAKALGTDTPSFAKKLKIPGLQPGETITLHDLLEAHRRAPEAANLATQIRAKELDLARREAEVVHAREVGLTQLQSAMERALQTLEGDSARVDWERLKAEDPIQYVTKRQEMSDREAALQQALAVRNQEAAALDAQRQQQNAANTRAKADQEQAKLFEKHPEWRDKATSERDFNRIGDMLGGVGMSFQEWVGREPDHRLVEIAHYAAVGWEYLNKSKPLALAKVQKLPPVARPGARTPPPDPKKNDLARATEAHKRFASAESAADRLRALRTQALQEGKGL
jgi:hypothetical protein